MTGNFGILQLQNVLLNRASQLRRRQLILGQLVEVLHQIHEDKIALVFVKKVEQQCHTGQKIFRSPKSTNVLGTKNGVCDASVLTNFAKEVYEGKVALEALERVGRNPQIKGIVHEVIYKDILNISPENVFSGTKCILSKSTNAVRDDLLLVKAGKIVGRMQLKDTPKSIGNTIKQIAKGHYKGTNLLGTNETKGMYDAAKTGGKAVQKMRSTGISSSDTARIGAKALGEMPLKDTLVASARSAGAVGAAVCAGVEIIRLGGNLLDGKITAGEFTGKVAKEGAGGYLSAATATTAATAATAATALALTATGVTAAAGTAGVGATAVAAAPIVVGAGVGITIGTVVKKLWNAIFD